MFPTLQSDPAPNDAHAYQYILAGNGLFVRQLVFSPTGHEYERSGPDLSLPAGGWKRPWRRPATPGWESIVSA